MVRVVLIGSGIISIALFAVTELVDGLRPISELTALGILAVVVWYLISRYLPQERETHRATIEHIQDRFFEREERRDAALREMSGAVTMLSKTCTIAQETYCRRRQDE